MRSGGDETTWMPSVVQRPRRPGPGRAVPSVSRRRRGPAAARPRRRPRLVLSGDQANVVSMTMPVGPESVVEWRRSPVRTSHSHATPSPVVVVGCQVFAVRRPVELLRRVQAGLEGRRGLASGPSTRTSSVRESVTASCFPVGGPPLRLGFDRFVLVLSLQAVRGQPPHRRSPAAADRHSRPNRPSPAARGRTSSSRAVNA